MLIIWLQGIWLPLHGYAYSETPLWAGIYLLPLTAASCSPASVRLPLRQVRLARCSLPAGWLSSAPASSG